MAHGMNTMPTARRGRTYYKHGANDSRGIHGFCSVLLVAALLVAPPLILLGSERSRRARYLALSDALDSDVAELNRGGLDISALRHLPPNALVHGVSDDIDAISSDADMGVALPGALVLRRNAEYCQWQEITSQSCETCTREVRAEDGSTRDETYQCNCAKQYDYVKAWRSQRINSLLFDQPGAHHNPQRDPMPSRTFAGEDASMTFRQGGRDAEGGRAEDAAGDGVRARLNPDMLSSGVRGQPYRHVEFTPDGRAPPPSFFARLFSFLGPDPSRTRYEPLKLLKDTPTSPAAVRDGFVYVGQGGWFFSPRESATSSKLFNWFAQYLEGSLFDWQFGDLMPSCTAGDVRFRYEVQDPAIVSVLGQLGKDRASNELLVTPRTMRGVGDDKAATIGLVHSGSHSAPDMLAAEDSDSRNRAHLFRALLLIWSIPASRLAGVALERELGESSVAVKTEGALGLCFLVLGATWLLIWGEAHGAAETTAIFFAGGTLGYLAYKSARRKGSGRRWRAVWCRVAQWANAPPEWRVEDSYVPAPDKATGRASKLS